MWQRSNEPQTPSGFVLITAQQPDLTTNAIAVTGGDTHCIALLADRTLQTWGNFQLGANAQLTPAPFVHYNNKGAFILST
jgi:hypothetical protein